jgi:hypothetical protein
MADNPYDVARSQEPPRPGGPESDPESPAKGKGASDGQDPGSYRARTMRGNVMMVLLFAAAAALVYGLTLWGGPTTASAEQQAVELQVDSTILRLSSEANLAGGGGGRISRQLLLQFYDEIGQRQIALGDLGKNPFRFVPPAGDAPVVTTPGEDQTPVDPQLGGPMPTRDEMVARLNRLNLQAIQRAAGGAVAIISNNLVTEGQIIEGFTVKRISLKEVILTWNGEDFELCMP